MKEADMAQATVAIINKPAWIDLSSRDTKGSRDFYAKVFGWRVEVDPDPQYGGYALAKIGDHDVAGIGGTQSPDAPTAWNIYIGTDDIADLAKRVQAAGGTVVAPPFAIGDQGSMAVFQDPSGAFISGWQGTRMGGFQTEGANAFGWAELNARGLEPAISFYKDVFGWTAKTSPMGEGQPPYTELQLDGQSIAGAMEMNPMVPAEVPSYWMAYFEVDDVDATHRKAVEAGASEMLPPGDFPGGRFSIVSDPQGAAFGLLKTTGR
jgi:predicted enzyme related to lactoylglutathione lyase